MVSAASASASMSAAAEVGAVVHAGGAQLHGELYAGAGAQLIAVHAQPESGRPTGGEHLAGLLAGERMRGMGLAEHVDPAGVRGGGLQHRPGDQLEVAGPVGAVLRRDDVGAQERGLGGELPGEPQRPGLVLDGQSVATLDLHRGGALPAHLGDPLPQQVPQFVVAGGPGRGHRRGDAAAVVGLAGHPGGELRAAVPGEHEVAVRIDEAGQHGASLDVDLPVGGRRVGRGAHPGDPPGLGDQRRPGAAARAGPRRCRRRWPVHRCW